jgi:hypothetical protein
MLFLLCTDQSVQKDRGDPSVDDVQAGTVVGRLEAILASFDGCDQALALSEISHRVGLPKSTVHRLANQLCAVGWKGTAAATGSD